MKFGVNVLNFGPGTSPETVRGWAHFAVEAGFDLLMISDHVAVTPDVQAWSWRGLPHLRANWRSAPRLPYSLTATRCKRRG